MTAPRKSKGAPTWYSRGHILSSDARAALISSLGFPADSQDPTLLRCLKDVEYVLGSYPGAVEAIDHAPNAKVYVQELETVKATALKLMTLLNSPANGINPFTRDTLCAHFEEAVSITGPDGIEKATLAAGYLVCACDSAIKAFQPEVRSETRGRKKTGARDEVVRQLLAVYEKCTLNPNNMRRAEFVSAALADISIKLKSSEYGDGESALSKLIRRNSPS